MFLEYHASPTRKFSQLSRLKEDKQKESHVVYCSRLMCYITKLHFFYILLLFLDMPHSLTVEFML